MICEIRTQHSSIDSKITSNVIFHKSHKKENKQKPKKYKRNDNVIFLIFFCIDYQNL